MITLFNSEKDFVGEWYRVRKSLGVSDTIHIGRIDKEATKVNQVSWWRYSHIEYDGIGALANALRENGYDLKQLPKTKSTRPTIFNILKAMMQQPALLRTAWNNYDSSESHMKGAAEQEPNPAYTVLNLEKTRIIKRNAREQGVSVNSWLMAALNRVVAEQFINDRTRYTWLCPINLRGVIKKTNPYANHSSGIYLNLHAAVDAQSIQGQLKQAVQRNEHWGMLLQVYLGALLGTKQMQRIYQRSIDRNRCVGSFSLLGQWQPKHRDDRHNKEAWLICGPGSPMFPVSNGVIDWWGQLTLCLKLHPVIADVHQSEELLERWVAALL